MMFNSSICSMHYHDDLKDPDKTSHRHRIVSLEIQLLWFEIEWWCLDSAGYGATEFRINRHWSKMFMRWLRNSQRIPR